MLRIGVIGPSELEVNPFIKQITNVQVRNIVMLDFHSGIYKDVEVVSVFSGVCKVNAAIATQVLISEFNVTHVFLIGVAGGLGRNVNVGDVIISTELVYHDVADEILTEYHPWMSDNYFKSDLEILRLCHLITQSKSESYKYHFGRIITGESFITDKERDLLIQRFNPLCVDMESASVAHTCYVNKIPFIVIRSITDNADENGSDLFESNLEKCALKPIRFIEKLISMLNERT